MTTDILAKLAAMLNECIDEAIGETAFVYVPHLQDAIRALTAQAPAVNQQMTSDFDPIAEIERLVRANDQLRERNAILIQQASQAPVAVEPFVLQMLVAAGHVTQERVDEAVAIAAKTPGAQQAVQAPAGWREQHDRDSFELRSLCRARDVARQERDHARACYDSALKLLTGIHALLYPAPITTPDGQTMVFRPTDPDPHAVLQELSDRIRALPDAIAASRPQPEGAQA